MASPKPPERSNAIIKILSKWVAAR